jgi:hypothetical protein
LNVKGDGVDVPEWSLKAVSDDGNADKDWNPM